MDAHRECLTASALCRRRGNVILATRRWEARPLRGRPRRLSHLGRSGPGRDPTAKSVFEPCRPGELGVFALTAARARVEPAWRGCRLRQALQRWGEALDAVPAHEGYRRLPTSEVAFCLAGSSSSCILDTRVSSGPRSKTRSPAPSSPDFSGRKPQSGRRRSSYHQDRASPTRRGPFTSPLTVGGCIPAACEAVDDF